MGLDGAESAVQRAAAVARERMAELGGEPPPLAGGWPGALLARHTLRHKSSKPSFRRVYWTTVVLNLGAFVAVFTPLLKS